MNTIVPLIDPKAMAALRRLVQLADGDTHQCRRIANFLLAWWNAGDLGGFDLTDLWNVDAAIRDDMVTVFAFVARNNIYPDSLGLKAEFEALVSRWRQADLADVAAKA